ncbi:MAG: hypothetical protein QXO35_01755 [Candidatus Micrarchaeia archaeon]
MSASLELHEIGDKRIAISAGEIFFSISEVRVVFCKRQLDQK